MEPPGRQAAKEQLVDSVRRVPCPGFEAKNLGALTS